MPYSQPGRSKAQGFLSLTGACEAVRRLQVSGLTKLLEGQKEASQGAGSRKENRRETWCPGAQGEGDPPHAPPPVAGCISLHLHRKNLHDVSLHALNASDCAVMIS